MYKIFYTNVSNINEETNEIIDESLVQSIETDQEFLTENDHIISRWDLVNWNEMQIRNKKSEIKNINDVYKRKVNALTIDTPEEEINTWSKQETEAKAFLLDNSSPTPLIDSICLKRNIDKNILVSKIIEKANLYSIAVGELTGERQKLEDEIKIKYQG